MSFNFIHATVSSIQGFKPPRREETMRVLLTITIV